MKNYIIRPIISKPGIQRDGTPFASESCIDGQWVRWYMGKPRKIGGYKLIDSGNLEIIRALFSVAQPNMINLYIGRASSVFFVNFDYNGDGEGEVNVTPDDYEHNPDNIWEFDLFTTTTDADSSSYIVGCVIPNGDDTSNIINGKVYYGVPGSGNRLVEIDPGINSETDEPNDPLEISGGIVFASPFMVAYGNNGFIRWSEAGRLSGNRPGMEHDKGAWPNDNTLTIANTKIIQAFTTRGSTYPQILCWTLNSLINVTYRPIATEDTFSSSVIQDNITVMSPDSVVQYDQQFFWIGIDQFYFFNGIVQRLDNSMSTDWFFQNINLSQRSKVWGMALPRYKEIWWFYPRDDAQECNAALIFNVELNTWYDSSIARSYGLAPSTFPYPLMSDANILNVKTGRGIETGFGLWMHEYGVDAVILNQKLAIPSRFETHILTLFDQTPEQNRLIRTRRIEPDFAQPPDTRMTVTVHNRMFPSDSLSNGHLISSGPYTFDGDTQKIDDVNSQGRLVSFVFESNQVGGTYQGGKTLLNFEVGDVRP